MNGAITVRNGNLIRVHLSPCGLLCDFWELYALNPAIALPLDEVLSTLDDLISVYKLGIGT